MNEPKPKRKTVKVFIDDYVYVTSQAKYYKESFADALRRLIAEVRT